MKNGENFQLLYDLADKLGAAGMTISSLVFLHYKLPTYVDTSLHVPTYVCLNIMKCVCVCVCVCV